MFLKSRRNTVAVESKNESPRVKINKVGSSTTSQTSDGVGCPTTKGNTIARAAKEKLRLRKLEQTTARGNTTLGTAILRIVPPFETRLASPWEVASEKKFHIRTPLNI